jgi:hypothetical protein
MEHRNNRMPFYIRKSLKAGPFRFNLSKSGVGVSVGIPGFRVGSGPRGNYVHTGRNGFYYRATLPSGSNTNRQNFSDTPFAPSYTPPISTTQVTEIKTAEVLSLQDSSFKSLLDEINRKQRRPFYYKIWGFLFIVLFVSLNAFFRIQTWFYFVAIPIAMVITVLTYLRDQVAKTTVLFYDLDGEVEKAYQRLHDTFQELQSCSRAWHIGAQGNIYGAYERKIQAGATSLIKRSSIIMHTRGPSQVSTNIAVPTIPAGRYRLYFLPDEILVFDGSQFGAVPYSDISLTTSNTRFIESDSVPHDTEVIDHTWQYVNKSGGPDRRFKYNRQIPVVRYSELLFRSSKGVSIFLQLSRPNSGSEFSSALREMAVVIENNSVAVSVKTDNTTTDSSFEKSVTELYTLLGHKILRTLRRSESTIDFYIQNQKGEKWIVRLENCSRVDDNLVREFHGMIQIEKPTQSALITSGIFTDRAREFINDKTIHLVDKNLFASYLQQARAFGQSNASKQ